MTATNSKRLSRKRATLTEYPPTPARLLNAAIAAIEEAGGCRGVNLRGIAQAAGCAHTNVYNYFSSYEALLWGALAEALERMSTFTQRRLDAVREPEEAVRAFVEAQIDFAVEHPGLYRLVWLEALAGAPPPAIRDRLAAMRIRWIQVMTGRPLRQLSAAVARRADDILHGYVHGEICKLICGRVLPAGTTAESRVRIVANVELLSELLLGARRPRGRRATASPRRWGGGR